MTSTLESATAATTTLTRTTDPATADTVMTTTGAAVTWRCAQAGLWVATRPDGRPAGIVSERWGRGFVVTACSGHDLGLHSTLAAGQAALEGTL
ncbi:MAG: hypothetical protein Q7T71_09430 [Herbiconiux sp.]|nr:hypothetical protein [Herbiconiux sp.]